MKCAEPNRNSTSFLFRYRHFIQFLINVFVNWPIHSTHLHEGWWLVTWLFCADLDISFNSYQRTLLKLTPQPHPWSVVVNEHKFAVQIWIFHPIPSSTSFESQSPPHSKEGWGLAIMTSLCRLGHFFQFQANIIS